MLLLLSDKYVYLCVVIIVDIFDFGVIVSGIVTWNEHILSNIQAHIYTQTHTTENNTTT